MGVWFFRLYLLGLFGPDLGCQFDFNWVEIAVRENQNNYLSVRKTAKKHKKELIYRFTVYLKKKRLIISGDTTNS